MESTRDPLGTFIPRPNEYERLVSYLLDQRFFLPVAISTSLAGGRGFGKTTLARTVCQDPRIQKAFAEGILWVTLGHGLAPLELVSRIETIIFQLSGKRAALKDLAEAETQLHELLHPRRSLLVIDEADDESALQPFMQSGPGGACLLISHDDNRLPVSARRVFVDIMMPEESAALLTAGFPPEMVGSAAPEDTSEPGSGPDAAQVEDNGRLLEDEVDRLAGEDQLTPPAEGNGGTVMADPALLVEIGKAERAQASGLPVPTPVGPFSPEVEELLEALADRLNEWPLLLALANGMMRGGLEEGDPDCASLAGALRKIHAALDRQEIQAGWRIDDAAQRKRVLDALLLACLEPLPLRVRNGYLDLAVFSEEESIPLAAAAVLWGLDGHQALAQVEQLARRALIDYNPIKDTLRLHSAMHACLRDQLWVGQFAKLNNRLVEAYQARCPSGWASGPDDGYYFQHLIGHMHAAGRHDEMQALLFDFSWLMAFLNCANCDSGRRGDLYALLSDYEMALSTSLDRQSAELRLVQEALRLSMPAITRDPHQLAPQLLGRLLAFAEPEIQSLVQKAKIWREQTWLRPLAACFAAPGSEEVRTLLGHTDWVTGVSIYPDGQHAVSSSLDGTLRVWDLANGQVLRIIEAHPDEIVFTDPKSATGGKSTSPLSDPRAEVDLEPMDRPRGTGSLAASALSPMRATGTLGGARVLNGTGALNTPPTALNPGGTSSVAVTPDGQRAVTAGWDGAIRIWNLATGQTEREIEGHIEPIGALILTPDGKHIITGADDRLIRVWDLESGQKVQELVGHTDLVRALAITPDGRTLVSGSWDNSIRLWDLETGEQLHVLLGHQGWVRSVTVTPDGYHVISGAWDRTLRIWDLWTGEIVRMLEGFRAPVFAIGVTPDNRLLITGGGDGSVGLWDFNSGEELRVLAGHTGGVNALTITAGGRFAISASDDRSLRIWDLVAVQGTLTQLGHQGPVHALAGLPDGRQLVSASWDGTIKVWEPAAGRELRVLEGHGGGVVALAVTADGKTALTGLRDSTLKLWNLATGDELRVLAGHEHPITAVAITSDGQIAASGDDFGVLKIWDLTSGACLAEFHGEGAIWACAITPDGHTVTASESSGKMYFLEIEK